MRAEAIAAFVISVRGLIIVEHPASMLGPARPVHQEAVLISLAFPESSDTAIIAMLPPQRGVDMTLAVKRCNEFIAVPRRSLRELLGAGEISLIRLNVCGRAVTAGSP